MGFSLIDANNPNELNAMPTMDAISLEGEDIILESFNAFQIQIPENMKIKEGGLSLKIPISDPQVENPSLWVFETGTHKWREIERLNATVSGYYATNQVRSSGFYNVDKRTATQTYSGRIANGRAGSSLTIKGLSSNTIYRT